MTATTEVVSLAFFVPGPPVPFTRVLKGSKEARAEKYRAYKLAVGLTAMQAGAEMIDGPVSVSIAIFDGQRHRRYDIDNVFKGICDALNEVCYVDDRQVVRGEFAIHPAGNHPEGVSVIVSAIVSGGQAT